MTLAELNNTLSSTGIPVAYEAFPERQSLPCITYNVAYSNNVSADSKVYQKVLHMDIFLYTKTKDVTTEELLENALDNASLFWQKTEMYLDGEKAFRQTYEVEI